MKTSFFTITVLPAFLSFSAADGLVVPPVGYQGSLNEKAQEAILIFLPGEEGKTSRQDLILKITVEGEAKEFGWLVPFPSEPRTGREDARLFRELHNYVQHRLRPAPSAGIAKSAPEALPSNSARPAQKVEVLSRKIVGSFDVAVVRENEAGALKEWLETNRFQVPENSEDLIAFYRKKKYVFACTKVSDAALKKDTPVDLHPLRFSFTSGGRDGIYFPMRMTGLQKSHFDINLYVFYDKWVNDKLSRYGFVHRGFHLRWRDYDSPACTPNAGKTWSAPRTDVYLRGSAHLFPTVTRTMQKLHPGRRFYLTNLYATDLDPRHVLDWNDDLWLFPYYTDPDFVPYDARENGPAALGY